MITTRHSHPELRLARILEREKQELKWFKPAPNQFRIYYKGGKQYEPDFVVETATEKLLLEPKMEKDMQDADVLAKAQAAARWCEEATKYELKNGGKAWKYVLIPHPAITDSASLTDLVSQFTWKG